MLRPRRLVALAALLALPVASTSAFAAEWHPVTDSFPSAAAPERAAETYLAKADALKLQTVELRFERVLPLAAHNTVRFAQTYHNLPVFGASAAVRLGPDGQVKLVVLDVARGLSVDVKPRLDSAAVHKAVEARFGMTLPFALATTLGVVPQEEGPGTLAYQVDVPTNQGGKRYLVDATSGQILRERNLAVDVLGRVYTISSVNTPTPEDVPLTDLDVSNPQYLNGWSGNLTVTNYASGDAQANNLKVTQDLQPNSGADFLYDPPVDPHDATDGFAQVGIYYHLTRIRDFVNNTLGVSTADASWKLVAVANYSAGGPVDNAFFSPQGISGTFSAPNLIAIGQGTTLDFADDSDVFLHEFTHYLSSNAIGYSDGQAGADEYGLSTFGGSIDEGTADYMACTINGDPVLGEASLVPFGAERDLTDKSKTCPDSLIGEVHEDGELIGSLTWSVREAFGSWLGDQVVWGGMTLLTKNPSFGDFGRGMQQTVDDLIADGLATQANRDTLDALLKERGLDDCDKVLDLSGGKDRTTTMFGLDLLGQAFGSSCDQLKNFLSLQSLFHFSATAAPGDKSLRFKVDLSGGSNKLDWSIYVRADQHVGFSGGGAALPTPNKYDYAVEHITATTGELVLDETSSPPFDPSKTYYMVIGHQNCPLTTAVVSASAVPPSTGEGGSGGATSSTGEGGATDGAGGGAGRNNDGTIEVDDGCGCRTPGGSSDDAGYAGLAVLALIAGGAARRRRS